VVPELLHEEMTASRIERELLALIEMPGKLDQMKQELARIRELALKGASGAKCSDKVADGLIAVAGDLG
jgi:lipid A disaccharide synthetase